MNKYIRTKDCIFELNNGLGQTPANVQLALIIENYKQADTIEELCDIYIEQDKKLILHKWNGNKMVIDWSTNQVYSLKELSACNIKGAIYTDKGLIYVAKLNDKGELELI